MHLPTIVFSLLSALALAAPAPPPMEVFAVHNNADAADGGHGDHHDKGHIAKPEFKYYPGFGEMAYKQFNFYQTARIGDIIHTAGQGGWDPNTSVVLEGRDAQIEQMFKNVELALKTAGGTGWDQVYHVRSYHIPLDDDTLQTMADHFKAWMPGKNKPVWTASGVVKLGIPGQLCEMDVEAYAPRHK